MPSYTKRIVDQELDELLAGLQAIAIEGPKAVGKTETATRRANTTYRLDDTASLELIKGDPNRLSQGPPPILIDEWQRFPPSWDIVRRSVDELDSETQFLLTGSATPVEAPAHSGAGRIVTLRMRPLSLAERSISTPSVSLAKLLSGHRPAVHGTCDVDLGTYANEIVASGFPAIRPLSPRLQRAQLDGYLERVVERDFVEQGHVIRNKTALRRWLTAYAAATGTTASYETIRDAASSGEANKPAKTTTAPYRATLEQLWMIDETPAWLPTRNRLRRLGASPVHHLADPALAARLLGIDADGLIQGTDAGIQIPREGSLLGALFESLVTLSVRTYAQANEARVRHLRTRGGEHEVDLIIERHDGRVVAAEVKLTTAVTDKDVRHLRWLSDTLGDDLLDAVVITTGREAYRRQDGIAVIPAALLTA